MGVVNMARAMDVADEIITLAQRENNPVSNLKLQKMMYFLNALSLILRNKPLIDDQDFEKWDYGPVIHSVYTEYSINGRNVITKPEEHLSFKSDENGLLSPIRKNFDENDLTQEERDFIWQNMNTFLKYSASQLVNFSHRETQWKNKVPYTYSNQDTREFYSLKANKFWEKEF